MTIRFKIEETIKDILNEMKTNNQWIFIEEGENVFLLKDHSFDSWAKVSYFPLTQTIFIDTAWSNFSYEIYQKEGFSEVTYIGAYNALLEQWLLPTLTPLNIMEAELKSSLLENKCSLAEFYPVRERFIRFKESYNKQVSTHPTCVLLALDKRRTR